MEPLCLDLGSPNLNTSTESCISIVDRSNQVRPAQYLYPDERYKYISHNVGIRLPCTPKGAIGYDSLSVNAPTVISYYPWTHRSNFVVMSVRQQTRALCATNGAKGKKSTWKPSDFTALKELSTLIRKLPLSSLRDRRDRKGFIGLPVYNPLANEKHAVVVSSETAPKKAVKAIRKELNRSRAVKKGGADPKALQFVGFDVEGANLGSGIPALIQRIEGP